MTNQEYRKRHLRSMYHPDEGCVFYVDWSGYCESQTKLGFSFCEGHLSLECWNESCDNQPVKSCAIQACEVVECRNHPHWYTHKEE